jgi:hypothetical protein
MSNQKVDYQKISGGVVASASANTNCWYIRDSVDKFSINGAFSSLQTVFDWVMVKTVDNRFFKSGVLRFCDGQTVTNIKFSSPFPDNDYFIFFSPSNNVNVHWTDKKVFKCTISSTGPLGAEVSWIAVHKELARMTGINNPGSIYSGKRVITTGEIPYDPSKETLDISLDADSNLNGWYNNEMIIKPTEALDEIYKTMNLSSYSVLTSSNININSYWLEKAKDRVKIGTSYPISCQIDYLVIKSGVNWWDEI